MTTKMTPDDRCSICGAAVGRGRNGGRLLHTTTVYEQRSESHYVPWVGWAPVAVTVPRAEICEGSDRGARP